MSFSHTRPTPGSSVFDLQLWRRNELPGPLTTQTLLDAPAAIVYTQQLIGGGEQGKEQTQVPGPWSSASVERVGEQRPRERQQQPRPSVCAACGFRMVWPSRKMEKSVFRKVGVITEEKTTKIPSAGFLPFSDCNRFFFFKLSLQKWPRTNPQHRDPNAKLLYPLFTHTGFYQEPVWTESHARGCGRWVGKQGLSPCSGHPLRTLVLGKIIFSQSDKMPAVCLWLIARVCMATPPCYLVLLLIVMMAWGTFISGKADLKISISDCFEAPPH